MEFVTGRPTSRYFIGAEGDADNTMKHGVGVATFDKQCLQNYIRIQLALTVSSLQWPLEMQL